MGRWLIVRCPLSVVRCPLSVVRCEDNDGFFLLSSQRTTDNGQRTNYATFANTSETLIERADREGNRLPTKAVPPPMAGPHHSAAAGIWKAGKKATGNFTPPINSLIIV